MPVILSNRVLGTPSSRPLLVIAHGLCGSGRNWITVGSTLAERGAVTLLDLRDHGQSPWSEELTYSAMASDFIAWWHAAGQPAFAFLGHSMGGKLGMVLATQHATTFGNQLKGLCCVDIAPKTYNPHYQSALQACLNLPLATLTSRKEADEALSATILNAPFRSFLLSNLERTENTQSPWRWRVNFANALKFLPQLAANPLSASNIYTGPTLIVAGSSSDFITPADAPLLATHFPQHTLTFLPTGHNVHIEQPAPFCAAVEEWWKGL